MLSKKINVLAIIGIALTIGVYIVMMGFPLKSFSSGGHTENVLLAKLSNEGQMTVGLYAGQWIILLSYFTAIVMLFLKKANAYIAQCFSIVGIIVLMTSLPSVPKGSIFESSFGIGFWIIIVISIVWTVYLYFASRKKITG